MLSHTWTRAACHHLRGHGQLSYHLRFCQRLQSRQQSPAGIVLAPSSLSTIVVVAVRLERIAVIIAFIEEQEPPPNRCHRRERASVAPSSSIRHIIAAADVALRVPPLRHHEDQHRAVDPWPSSCHFQQPSLCHPFIGRRRTIFISRRRATAVVAQSSSSRRRVIGAAIVVAGVDVAIVVVVAVVALVVVVVALVVLVVLFVPDIVVAGLGVDRIIIAALVVGELVVIPDTLSKDSSLLDSLPESLLDPAKLRYST